MLAFFFFLISRVSYLYIVMLMSNSGGADGLGVSGSQSLRISLPITHLAPVAISPRALWWRRPPRRPLGAGAFAFFFSPSFECHLSVWLANAPRWPPLARLPSASRVPELGRLTFAPSHPRQPQSWLPSSSVPRAPPHLSPQRRKKPPSSLSWISLSLLFGPQMRKTVLPDFGFPKSLRKFNEGDPLS